MPSLVSHLTCPACGERRDHRVPVNVCACGSPLLVDYDLEGVAVGPDEVTGRAPDMWRYREILPLDEPERAVTLGEGMTPLLRPERLGALLNLDLRIKDEGRNPTGSFKDRGASCGISRARELGITEVALPSAGNAAGAWAAYGAAAGISVHVAMPRDAPELNQLECLAYGADLTLVDGLISDAGRLLAERGPAEGWFDAATLREPYRIEGKKTLGFEIAEQLDWEAPDAIVYPAGGGVGAIGIWRAFEQLMTLGWVRGDAPRIVVVQAAGCAPIVQGFERGDDSVTPWPDAATLAAGLRVPSPLGGPLVLRAIRETNGTAVAVPDDAIVEAVRVLAREAGVLAAPEGAATFAALRTLLDRGDLSAGERVVLLNTGSGLKYPEVLAQAIR
jgi:threonine synthase